MPSEALLPTPPLVPAEVDLRDFQGMWFDTERLLRSDTWGLGNGDEKAAAMSLWLESWHQLPAASLPSHDRMLAKLSQAERWAKSKAHALRGWVPCTDGRLYHPVVAEKALEAWIEKLAAAINGAEGNAKRWQINVDTTLLRNQLRTAADLLRNLNAASRVFKKKAVVVILSASHPESPPDSPPESPPESPPDDPLISPPDRKGPERNGPEQTGTEQTGLKRAPSPAAAVTMALREAGMPGTNPSHPTLLMLLEAGATVDEFVSAAPAAKGKRDPFSYLLTVVKGRREDAAKSAGDVRRGAIPNRQEAQELRNRTVAERWAEEQATAEGDRR